MKLKQLFTDDSAVSPVIGVILMVAITVILAAVIGTFVLNLGGSISQTTPQASFGFDFEPNQTDGFTVTHETGASIDLNSSSLRVVGDGGVAEDWEDTSDNKISAGDQLDLTGSNATEYSPGGTYRVVWASQNDENSATLSEATAPSN